MPIRAFQDGPYVFIHSEGDLLGQNFFFDLFRMADGKIVEHWAFSKDATPPDAGGETDTGAFSQVSLGTTREQSRLSGISTKLRRSCGFWTHPPAEISAHPRALIRSRCPHLYPLKKNFTGSR
jgi:hypothetical protein